MPDPVATIVRLDGRALAPPQLAEIDAIFFEASGRAFALGPERDAFRERWLGRYFDGACDVVLLALSKERTVAGYLVGALEDPAEQHRFADIGYFQNQFRDLCRRYPAHLHLNLAPAFRGQGLGAQLIAAFAAHASAAGARGMHVVTQAQARNQRFYLRCGFTEVGKCMWNASEIAFLAKPLAPPKWSR
jgi:GNAT superfamily N-acetyltransferase